MLCDHPTCRKYKQIAGQRKLLGFCLPHAREVDLFLFPLLFQQALRTWGTLREQETRLGDLFQRGDEAARTPYSPCGAKMRSGHTCGMYYGHGSSHRSGQNLEKIARDILASCD